MFNDINNVRNGININNDTISCLFSNMSICIDAFLIICFGSPPDLPTSIACCTDESIILEIWLLNEELIYIPIINTNNMANFKNTKSQSFLLISWALLVPITKLLYKWKGINIKNKIMKQDNTNSLVSLSLIKSADSTDNTIGVAKIIQINRVNHQNSERGERPLISQVRQYLIPFLTATIGDTMVGKPCSNELLWNSCGSDGRDREVPRCRSKGQAPLKRVPYPSRQH